MVFDKIKRWFLLRKAKEEEKKHIPTKKEIEEEHAQFMKQAEKLKKVVTRKKITKKKRAKKKITKKKSSNKKIKK